MSFLEELENNNNNQNEEKLEKTPRELWESCFMYFKHFVSILQKEKKTFESEFNFIFLSLKKPCKIVGPYEIHRTQNDEILKLEIQMHSQLNKSIKINRKDQRSAELLRIKLSKDNILSTVKTDKDKQHCIELNPNIRSTFKLILKNNKDFYIEYYNIAASNKRILKLNAKDINEATMDSLAKYILGQNPTLYTETISNQEITKIREQIELNKRIKEKRDVELKIEKSKHNEAEELRKSNTLSAKSKRYFSSHKDKLLTKFRDKFQKSKAD